MDPLLPIRRLRIELDRTLRGRAFFSRAARGRLLRGEYLDLVVQLSALVQALAADRLGDVAALGEADAAELLSGSGALLPAPRSPAIQLAAALRAGAGPEWSDDIALAVLATSWTGDALEELQAAFPRSRRLLQALADRSPDSLERLRCRLHPAGEERQRVYALAELVRGALLGVATYLDLAWPAPLGYLSLEGRGGAFVHAHRN